jgi:RNA polymerase sigma factor (sigma-70 family)
MAKPAFTTNEVLNAALRQGDNNALEFVYKSYWPMISRFVRSNSGNLQDAEEVYQESIILLYEKLRKGEVTLTCSIKTYIYSICRNKWLQVLKGRKTIVDIDVYNDINPDHSEEVQELPEDKEIIEAISAMGNPCRSLLIGYYYHQLSLENLADKLKYTSANVAKQQKFRCMERLKKLFLQSDQKYAHE